MHHDKAPTDGWALGRVDGGHLCRRERDQPTGPSLPAPVDGVPCAKWRRPPELLPRRRRERAVFLSSRPVKLTPAAWLTATELRRVRELDAIRAGAKPAHPRREAVLVRVLIESRRRILPPAPRTTLHADLTGSGGGYGDGGGVVGRSSRLWGAAPWSRCAQAVHARHDDRVALPASQGQGVAFLAVAAGCEAHGHWVGAALVLRAAFELLVRQ